MFAEGSSLLKTYLEIISVFQEHRILMSIFLLRIITYIFVLHIYGSFSVPQLFSFLLPEADLDGGVQGVRPPKIRKTYVIQR
jgi:hypothetical protein